MEKKAPNLSLFESPQPTVRLPSIHSKPNDLSFVSEAETKSHPGSSVLSISIVASEAGFGNCKSRSRTDKLQNRVEKW